MRQKHCPKPKNKILNQTRHRGIAFLDLASPKKAPSPHKLKYEIILYKSVDLLAILECQGPHTKVKLPY